MKQNKATHDKETLTPRTMEHGESDVILLKKKNNANKRVNIFFCLLLS